MKIPEFSNVKNIKEKKLFKIMLKIEKLQENYFKIFKKAKNNKKKKIPEILSFKIGHERDPNRASAAYTLMCYFTLRLGTIQKIARIYMSSDEQSAGQAETRAPIDCVSLTHSIAASRCL